jgi:hypothetical protein
LVYDDDNFEEVSETADGQNPKKRRINIDKEETIPDIRKSKRTDVESPRKSVQLATGSPSSGRAPRSFSG